MLSVLEELLKYDIDGIHLVTLVIGTPRVIQMRHANSSRKPMVLIARLRSS